MEVVHERAYTSASPRKWVIAPPVEESRLLGKRLGVSRLVAQCLWNRGLKEPDAARGFLQPRLKDLYEPEELSGVAEVSERLAAAVRDGRRIVIYGDYDVDGTTGTAILWHVLTLAGADVDFFIPHRIEEGYGLNGEALRRIAQDGGQIVVTVDCGITAVEEARLAGELGLELIITDHHQLPDELRLQDVMLYGNVNNRLTNQEVPIAFDPSGFMDPFLLHFQDGGEDWTFRVSFMGRSDALEGYSDEPLR